MNRLDSAIWFRLASSRDAHGVSCDEDGAFIGLVPLLARGSKASDHSEWTVRPFAEINSELSACYGLPIDMSSKAAGLNSVVDALNHGDFAFAQLVLLSLRIPNPPRLAKRNNSRDIGALVSDLARSRMLKGDWNTNQHPRWPAGDTEHHGGEFRPVDSSPSSNIIPTQAIVEPLPWGIPWDVPFVRPTEILPPPVDIPGAERQRPPLINPFPKKRKCVEEWDAAYEYCDKMKEKGLFKPGRAGPGADYFKCVMGQVSEECGGNATGA